MALIKSAPITEEQKYALTKLRRDVQRRKTTKKGKV